MTTIFAERAHDGVFQHVVKGCEKLMVFRGGPAAVLEVESQSLSDARERKVPLGTFTGDVDICIGAMNTTGQGMCWACGQKITFKLTGVDPQNPAFLDILEESCVPEPCCDC